MKKVFLGIIMLLGMMILTPFSSGEAASDQQTNIIVKYEKEHDKKFIIQQSDSVVKEYSQLPLLEINISKDVLQELISDKHIVFYEENKSFSIQNQFKVANISSTELERWNLKAMDVQNGWNAGFTGKGVKIAIIDSGVANHSDLTVVGGASFVGNSYEDDHGHGTHVAGIIVGKHNGIGVAGIAPNAEVYALKAIGKDGKGDVADVLKAIDWAIENKMHIINLSFGDLEYAKSLHEGVKKAADHGIMIVAASGNEGNDSGTGNTINYPARHDEVISVASINRQFKRSSFSGTGNTNDFAAPGEEIYSTYLNGQYATYNGTSMATPHITGVLALLMEQYPYATATELRDGLRYIAEDLGEVGYDSLYGYGLPKFKMPNSMMMSEMLNSDLSATSTISKIETMPNTIEKLALKNDWNKSQQTIISQIDQILADFVRTPTEQKYNQLIGLLEGVVSVDIKLHKQKQLDATIARLFEPATNAVNVFNRNKTNYNYKKAETELKKLPSLKPKQELEAALNEGLQQFAKKAIDGLAQYEKQPTKKHYDYALFSINSLPDSSVKSELMEKMKKQVQTAVKQATAKISAYEKKQTLKNYINAENSIKAVFDDKERSKLELKIKKTVNNNMAKAKTRVANYEKKKSETNRNLAMKIVRELPNGKEKEQLLKRLK
ncbi:S8 family peptidase [Solibacillus sp. A46]|uniref:S8 family peptidase n=1 Tax=Solibacillus faecavium TaxID=2762221 RepID=A0ABR8XUZ1_9BACL|nr:S8 family peptidase [Solibacillus faecavium]MBD8035764.1 S8 family peptidase [Solibacillus faecavium]